METATTRRIAPIGSTIVCPYLMVESVESSMEFLVKVFNAAITNDANRQNGFIQHGEVMIGDTTVMLGRSGPDWPARQSMNYIFVENADETYERALKNGGTSIMPPAERPYGIREGGFSDQFGNQWWVGQLIKAPENTAETALIQAELQWGESIEANDADKILSFIDDDWVIISTEGGIAGKTPFLDLIRSGDLVHTKMEFQIMYTRIYSNMGIVVSKGTSAGAYKLEPFSYYELSTSLFVKNGDGWKAVLTMLTPAKD